MANRTDKPPKPYTDFPLFAHASGQWAKKIDGRMWYFGVWAHPQAALQQYLKDVHEIKAGRDPRRMESGVAGVGTCTVLYAVNAFLSDRENRMLSGQLSRKQFSQYRDACKRLLQHFGRETLVSALTPRDFTAFYGSFPNNWAVSSIARAVGLTITCFRFAYESDLIDKPVKFGPGFKRPTKLQKRRELGQKQAKRGRLDFTPAEARLIIQQSKYPTLKACILLGLNGGFGNTDCASLTLNSVDLKSGWIDFPRPKTGIDRKLPLWPETVVALKEAIERRRAPELPEHLSLVFLTGKGKPLVWDRLYPSGRYIEINNLTHAFGKLLRKHSLHKQGHNFYSLRRTFETVAGASKDQVAVDAIMGHEDGSMASVYRQGIEAERLVAVTQFVRQWLLDGQESLEDQSESEQSS